MKSLISEGCVAVNNSLYFIAKEMNLIFSIDRNTGNTEIIGSLPNESMDVVRLGARILKYNDWLIFVPMNASNVSLFNVNSKQWKYVKIEIIDEYFYDKFFNAYIYDDSLVLVGSVYPAIVIINLLTEKVEYIREPYENLKEIAKKVGDCFIRCDAALVDGKLYLASCVNNKVLIFDIKSRKWEWKEVGAKSNRYSGIAWDGSWFWLSPRKNGNIIKWNGLDESKEYVLSDNVEDIHYFLGIVYDGKYIILPGMNNSKTLVIDPNESEPLEKMTDVRKAYWFFDVISEGQTIGMLKDGTIEIYSNGDLNDVQEHYNALIEEHQIIEFVKNRMKPVYENSFFDLNVFIEGL